MDSQKRKFLLDFVRGALTFNKPNASGQSIVMLAKWKEEKVQKNLMRYGAVAKWERRYTEDVVAVDAVWVQVPAVPFMS